MVGSWFVTVVVVVVVIVVVVMVTKVVVVGSWFVVAVVVVVVAVVTDSNRCWQFLDSYVVHFVGESDDVTS